MTNAPDFTSIPVIDISPLYGEDLADARAVAADIRRASIEAGFFYIRGHHMLPDLMRATLMASKFFFSRPEAEKRSIQVNGAHRGYVPFAQTTLGRQYKADLKESFNFAFPFAADDPDVVAGKPLIGVNQWPQGEEVWRGVLEDYYRTLFEVGQRVLEGFALALEAPRTYFRDLYKRPLVRTRLLHYPPQPEGSGEDQFGAAPHTDWGCMTLLWQDQVGGLQVPWATRSRCSTIRISTRSWSACRTAPGRATRPSTRARWPGSTSPRSTTRLTRTGRRRRPEDARQASPATTLKLFSTSDISSRVSRVSGPSSSRLRSSVRGCSVMTWQVSRRRSLATIVT